METKRIIHDINKEDTTKIKKYLNKKTDSLAIYCSHRKIDDRYCYSFLIENFNDNNKSIRVFLSLKDIIKNEKIEKVIFYKSIYEFQKIESIYIYEFDNDFELLFKLKLTYDLYKNRAEHLDLYKYTETAFDYFHKALILNRLNDEYELMEILCLYSSLSNISLNEKNLKNDLRNKFSYFGFNENDIKDDYYIHKLREKDNGNNKEFLLYSLLNPTLKLLFKNESCEGEFQSYPIGILKSYAILLDIMN